MTDSNDYTAKIRAKGLDSTGITEQIAAEMYRNKGRRYMGIVELVVDETHEKADGTRKVDLVLSLVEPAIDGHMAEYLRELTRVTYRNRQQADGQLAIDDSLREEPTVAQVLAGGQRFRPHPFLPDDAGKDTPICDVCGGIEASAVHSAQDQLPDEHDEHEEHEEHDDDVEDEQDPYDLTHTKDHAPVGADTACGLRATAGKSLRTHTDSTKVTCPACLDAFADDTQDEDDDAPADDYSATNLQLAPIPAETRPLTAVPDPFTTPAGA